jgi:two-component system, OmpR family, phosphate regulon sensor histidine kinase PhoR
VFGNVQLQKFISSVLTGQETQELELVVQQNMNYHLQVRGTNLFGLQGARLGAVIVFNDVSRLRRLENLRSDFVANVSHELKTPITSIKGFIETLLDGAINDPEEADRFLKIVAKHADRLNAIIDDLLTLSRLEQGDKKKMNIQEVGLTGLMNSASEACSHRAVKKKVSIQVECEENITALVNPPLIEQALINLVGNAVKYSDENKAVTIKAVVEQGGVMLSVADQGFGVEPEHLDRLFERFYRVGKGRSRQEGGTGLGLAIVKHIAQAHGGNVSVQSTFGEGSVFSIFIPSAS